MTKRMLVDATHPEEVRVAIVHDQRLIDLDIETCTKAQIKGNIYLGRVTRVEPSLQAAFVDFNGGRQGFLSVNDVNPKYYPVQEPPEPQEPSEAPPEQPASTQPAEQTEQPSESAPENSEQPSLQPVIADEQTEQEEQKAETAKVTSEPEENSATGEPGNTEEPPTEAIAENKAKEPSQSDKDKGGGRRRRGNDRGGRGRRRQIPIQDILKKGQLLLLQVVKEARGTKGASLTTNISLAGRYTVLLPENSGGGGISRKIMDNQARKALKTMLASMEIPQEVSLIIRTAGMERTKREITRDMSYLTRLWKTIQDKVETCNGPALIHEEGDLIIRTIRDLYSTEMEEILIEGNEAYRRGKDFMRLLMPRYVKAVQPYKDRIPLFSRYQVEHQIESMHERTISLKSGGYLVIEPTEALVSIDINSGRSTKEKNVENTAFKTNMQAVDEIARQLRLRDLGGLVVIDFIDMEEKKHNSEVEKRLKEALKGDRAKIQLGKISQFGLMELSRQRMKPAFNESNREVCPRCTGLGTIRSVESTAIRLFRCIEEDTSSGRFSKLIYHAPADVANYLHNHKRRQMVELEIENDLELLIEIDPELQTPHFRKDRVARTSQEEPNKEREAKEESSPAVQPSEGEEKSSETPEAGEEGKSEGKKRKRRRKRKRNRDRTDGAPGEEQQEQSGDSPTQETESSEVVGETNDGEASEGEASEGEASASDTADSSGDSPSKKRRRRRRRRRAASQEEQAQTTEAVEQSSEAPQPPSHEEAKPVEVSTSSNEPPPPPLLIEEQPDTPQPVLVVPEPDTPQPSMFEPAVEAKAEPQPAIQPVVEEAAAEEAPAKAVKKPVRKRRKPAAKKVAAEETTTEESAEQPKTDEASPTADQAAEEKPKRRRRTTTPRKKAAPKKSTEEATPAEQSETEVSAEASSTPSDDEPEVKKKPAARKPRKRATTTTRKRAPKKAAKPKSDGDEASTEKAESPAKEPTTTAESPSTDTE
ncbi:Rne/Rng family ribonuclease [Magnetococcus sp. PR-3]|uniref:Rne/Rng family ribonuclease n=1 Tax=Magnetococcus sp. PR-3 TaxID=3120355 RepID=UPI002FCE673D